MPALLPRRLWHQLTVALVEFTGSPQNSKGQNFLEVRSGAVAVLPHHASVHCLPCCFTAV